MASANNENVFQCAICLENDDRERKLHDCGNHEFHKVCLERAMKTSELCPLCRFKPKPIRICLILIINPIPCLICNNMIQFISNIFTIYSL